MRVVPIKNSKGRRPPMKARQKTAPRAAATKRRYEAFTEEEKDAMKQRVSELKVGKAEGETAVLEKIAEMSDSDRAMAKRVHAVIKASAPTLSPKLWYGMPAYATAGKDGKIVCFFQPAQKFKTRYSTLGFNDAAHLDEGGMWPVAFALQKLTAAEEAKLGALVKKAVS
jgi:uncharacterized protein YdhG (YjbR/CyaY superfamily)